MIRSTCRPWWLPGLSVIPMSPGIRAGARHWPTWAVKVEPLERRRSEHKVATQSPEMGGVRVPGLNCEPGAVVCQQSVDLAGHNLQSAPKDVPGHAAESRFNKLDDGALGSSDYAPEHAKQIIGKAVRWNVLRPSSNFSGPRFAELRWK